MKGLFLAAIVFLANAVEVSASTPMAIGEQGSIIIPFNNNSGSIMQVDGVTLTAAVNVPGVTILDTSYLGPVSVFPGYTAYFHVDFQIGTDYNLSNSNIEITIDLTHASPSFLPASRRWIYKTQNLFKTIRGDCLEPGNVYCGEYQSPDTEPPVTEIIFSGPEYIDTNARRYIAATTSVNLSGGDAYIADSNISGVALTKFKADVAPSGFEGLQLFLEPVTMPEGLYTFYFASRDNAGNTEPIKSTIVTVDDTAPGSPINLRGGGPSIWKNTKEYNLSWTNPPDVAGVAGARVKFGVGKPESNSEGVFFEGVDSIVYPTPDIGEGPAPIWLWLEDKVGNANPDKAEMLTLYYDGIDPFSSASSPEYSNANVVAVAFAASDEGSLGENPTGSGVKETVLWHRHNEGAWSAGETKTGLSGTFSFNTQGALGTWEFYTQAFDKAGNSEPQPGGEVKAKTDTFVDITAPIISGLSATAFSPDTAVLEWTTDDETTAVIDYSRTATQGPVPAGQYNETKLGRIHRVTITGLPNPAEINFTVTAKNRTGLTTVGLKSCNMPLNVSYETDLFGVIDYSQPVKVYVTNPDITQASLMVNGSVWSGPVGVDKPATLLVDPATTGDGSHELHTSAGSYEYASSVIVDAAVRTVKLVRLVISAGGAMNPDGESAATAGQAAQQEMAAPGGGSKLYPGYYAGIDPVAPAGINLTATAAQAGQITLKWTAPGDDGGVGTAMQYEVRYSPEGITDGNFNSAALAANIQPPRKAGDDEVIMISGLENGKMYYFAIKAYDELMNSSLSNIVAKETLEVAQSEEKIGADPALTVISPIKDVQIKRTDVVANAAALKIALAAGLAPIGNIFEITTTQPFPAGVEAQVHFRYANPVDAATEKDFAVYKYSPASGEWTVLIGALDAENNIIRAVTSSFSLYAIFGKDKTPPLTTAALSGGVRYTDQAGNVFVSGAAKVALTASDSGGGIERTEYRLDSSNGPFELYVSSVQIAEGWHTIQFRSVDKAGNTEAPKSLFMMKDALAPRTEFNFAGQFARLPGGVIHISSTTSGLDISVLDYPSSGSGLKKVTLELDGVQSEIGSEHSIPLYLGRHDIKVRAEDNVGNIIETKADVVVGDLLPPIVTAPTNNFAASGSTVAFSWQHQTTTFFSLTEYDLMLGGEPGFATPEFVQVVSSQVKVTVRIDEAGLTVQGLVDDGSGALRLITEQMEDLWTGALEGVMETPAISLPNGTIGISSFTVIQSENEGGISHDYKYQAYYSAPTSYQPITPGAGVSMTMSNGGWISFRSTLRRNALKNKSPTLTVLEFVVTYRVWYYNSYCHRHGFSGYHCHNNNYYYDYSNQKNASALSAVSHEGLRFNGPALELITEPGALAGEWLSQVYPVPDGAYRIGDFLQDFDANGGAILFEFSKSGGAFRPASDLESANFRDGDTLQFKAIFSRATSSDLSPVFRGINFNFIAPPPTGTEFSLPGERKYYWRVAAKDYLGRFSAPSEERLIIYDTKPPLTEHLLEGATGQGGWYVAPVSASLISTDAVAGVGGAYYSVDGSTFALYASSFTLNTEGTSLFRYYSEDAVGNREAEKSFTAKIDLSSPSIMASVSPAPNQWGWNNTGVGVLFSGSDTVSGLAYCTSSATVAGEIAGREVAGACFDNAGLSSTRAVSVSIDTTAPSIQYAQSPAANELGWNTGTVTVKFTCADNLSGIRACPPDVYLVGEGASISTSAKVYDSADNSTGVSVTGIKIDRTLPISSAALSGTYKDGWYSSPVGITLTSTDSLSGIKETLYSMNGAAFSPYLPPMTVTADGVHAFRYYSKDKAGNAEAEKILSFSIDRTAPQIGFALNPQPNSNDWNNSSVQVVFNGTDTLSGMDICVSSRTSAEGAGKTLSGWCRDIAGNISYSTAIVNVDFSSPVVSAVQTPLPNTHGWNNVPVMVRFSGMDAISGTASCTGDTPISVEGVGQQVLGSCTDRAGNVGSYVRAVNIDRTPPAVNISSPAAGQTYIATRGNIPVMYDVSDNFDTAPAVEAFFVQTEDRGSPRGVRPAKLAVSKGQSIEPLSIDDGIWRLTVSATDFADNAAYLAGGAFKVVHDVLPPRTAQTVSGGPLYAAGSMAYIRKETELKLTSADDLVASGDAAGLGVKGQSVGLKTGGIVVKEISFNNPAPAQNAVFVSTFSLAGLADGLYYLLYKAVDVLENTESTRISTAALDNTAPVTAHHIGSPYYTAGGVNYITPATPVTFTAGDPAVNAVASGVNRVEVSVDGAPFTVNTSTLNLAEGRHSIKYRAIDNLGNTEAEKTLEVRSDNTPPVSGFNASGQYFEAAGHKFAPLSFTYLIASADPVMNNVASGVKFSEYRIDGGAFGAYASTFTLSEGIRLVEYRSQDNVSNLEQIKLATVHVDATAPATALVVSGGMQFAGSAAGSFYASLASRFGLAALDPLSNGVASGVKQTSWRDNSGSIANTVSGLVYSEGRHELAYWTRDNVENVEVVRSTTILVDNTAPVSEHHIGSPYYAAGGVNYITPTTPVSFTAGDPVANEVAAGLARIETAVDGGQWQVYAQPLTLAEGRHTIKYRSVDNVGNTEVEKTLEVRSDNTPPASGFNASGQYFEASGHKFAPLSFTYSLTSADPVVNNVASGVKYSEYRIDGDAFGAYASAFSLDEGIRLVEYRSHDNVANAELVKSVTVYADNTVPQSSLAIGLPRHEAAGSIYVSTWTLFTLSSADPIVNGVAAGVKDIRRRFGADAFGVYSNGFIAPSSDGNKVLEYYGTDNVGNTEAAKSQAVKLDATAPMTVLNITGGIQYAGPAANSFYASAASRFGLAAADPVSGGVASGVKQTSWRDNNGAVANTISGLAFNEGRHELTYWTMDNVENVEVVRSTTILVDNTAPVIEYHIGGPYYAAGGVNYITPATPVSFTAGDPVAYEVAAGLARIETIVDGGQWQVYVQPLTFAEGRHTIKYRSVDNVGNTEAEKTLEVRSDNTPPVSGFNASGQYFEASGHKFAPLSFAYSLTSTDPLVNNVASGMKFSEYRIDGSAFGAYTSVFSLAEGIRLVEYRSHDNVANTELIKASTVYVDNTVPQSSLAISHPKYAASGGIYISTWTLFTLSSVDPEVNGVAAGVQDIRRRFGADAFGVYSTGFIAPSSDGNKVLEYYGTDNLGNTEAAKSQAVKLDATAPMTALNITGGMQYAGPAAGSFYASLASRFGLAAADHVIGGVASGVKLTAWRDNNSTVANTIAGLAFSEGRHELTYWSTDNVENIEVARSTTILVDNTAPVSEHHIGSPYYPVGGLNYITPATPVSFTATDPVAGTVASGVSRIEVSIDGSAFGVYSSALTFAEGRHTIKYRGIDNVGNTEAEHTFNVQSDATTPATALAVSGGSQYAGPAAGSFYASLASRFGLVAVDPLSNSVASGVKLTSWRDNNGTVANTISGLAFSEGRHELAYWSTDNVENIEVVRSTTVLVDNTAPVTEHHIGNPYYSAGGVNYITPATPLSFSAVDPAVSEVSAGVARIETAVDGGQWLTYTQPLKFAEGRHTIEYRAIDNVGNTEAVKTLSVQSDATAPVSAWLVSSGEHIELGGKFYLNALGKLALESGDPVAGNVASGVEGIYYGIDSAPSARYTAAFGLAEGIRTLNFNARDNVANAEVVKSTAIYVDGTKPVSELSISGDQYHGDKVYVSLRSAIVLTAADSVVSEVASGLRETRYSVDGGAFADYSSFKPAAEGKRLVSFYSADQVGNVEVTKTSELWVDATAPNTPLSIAGARYDADGLIYITKDSGIVLTPADPVAGETASGVLLTKYRIDGGLWQVYSGSFTITVEGRHTLEYYSLDRVLNTEALKTAALAVDNTPPATAITLGEPKYEAFGLPILRPETPITLAAADITAGEVVSGLRSIFYEAVNLAGGGSGIHSYVEPFTLPQGTYDVRFWSVDNVGNTESYKQKRLAVSTYQDDSLQAVDGLDLSGTADIAGAVKSNGVVSVSGNARILGDVTTSTITLTGGNAQITGQLLNGQTPLSPEPIYLPAIAESSGSAIPGEFLSAGELTLNSQTELTLTTGTYYVRGIKLSGGSTIRIAGKVELLVSGEISISGGSSFNAAGAASGLTIFVNTASSISFTGGGNLVARVYAPYSHLKLAGNALLGGHFFARRAAVSGTGNIIQAGETLPQTTSEPAGGGGKKKASALAVGGGSYDVLAGPDPAFRLGEVYVFPNPAKGSEAPVFHIETGIAESVKINIYTVSGRVAHEHTLAGLPVELDDGNGLSYAYEYVWRGHIPSGVYLYYIEARKAGQTLKKTGKFSVVR